MLEVGVRPAADSALLDSPSGSFGDYELIEEIARGGMGVVFKARQIGLNRMVALKVIRASHLASEADLARFRQEAQTVASLKHPNIVAIHEVGDFDGQPYFSMDYIEGQNLAELVREKPLSAARAAAYLKTVAEAIHYAHERGILHRDLKPSNVLIDHADQPHVTDFGLAKRLNNSELGTGNSELTLSGQVLGSPNFMPPEQAAGRHRELTPASDVYSLGALLYHLLTGRPPFLADNIPATLRMVSETDPVAPRLLVPTVSRDLETICLKCLEKDPRRRYATAQELADEFDRFLRDEPIRARPVAPAEKFWRWCRRHPIIAALTGVIGVLLLAVALISTAAAARLQRANREGQEKLREAYLSQARASRWSGRPGRRFDSLDVIRKAAEIRSGLDLRNEAIAAMALVDIRPLKTWEIPESGWGFDAELAQYSRGEGPAAVLCRTTDGAEIARVIEPGATNCYYPALSRDGRYLLAGFERDGERLFTLFDLGSGKTAIRQPNLWLRNHDFSGDGRWLLVTSHRKKVGAFYVLYDLTALQPVFTNALPALTSSVHFSPDGDKLAVTYLDHRQMEIRNPRSGVIVQTLLHDSGVHFATWSADGTCLATGARHAQAYVWDVTGAPKLRHKLPHRGEVVQVAFNPSGTLLLTRGWDSVLRFWDPYNGNELLHVPSAGLSSSFTPDGRRLVSWPTTHRLAMLEVEEAREWQRLRFVNPGGAGARSCEFSPDGRWLVSTHQDGVRLWDLASLKEVAHIRSAGDALGALFHPSGTNLIVMFADGPVEWWPLSPGADPSKPGHDSARWRLGPPEIMAGTKALQHAKLDRAGKLLLGIGNGQVRVLDLESRQFTWHLPVPVQPHRSALDPTGRWGLVTPYRMDDH